MIPADCEIARLLRIAYAKEQKRQSGCDGKVAYPTKAAALRVAGHAPCALDVYRCGACHAYHIGKSKPKTSGVNSLRPTLHREDNLPVFSSDEAVKC